MNKIKIAIGLRGKCVVIVREIPETMIEMRD